MGLVYQIIVWIILGGISGWIASIIMNKNASMDAKANILVGIAGAFIGGFIMNLIGGSSVRGLSIYSILVSVAGACILLLALNKMK